MAHVGRRDPYTQFWPETLKRSPDEKLFLSGKFLSMRNKVHMG